DDLGLVASLIGKDLPYRRQQADLGVAIATAGLHQSEWDAVYMVTRSFFSVQYARRQEQAAKKALDKLRTIRDQATGYVKLGLPDVVVTQLDVDKLTVTIDLYQAKMAEATQGILGPGAARRGAWGVGPGWPRQVAGPDSPAPATVPCLEDVVALAWARRGEIVQAVTVARVVELEVCAQEALGGPKGRTFALA